MDHLKNTMYFLDMRKLLKDFISLVWFILCSNITTREQEAALPKSDSPTMASTRT